MPDSAFLAETRTIYSFNKDLSKDAYKDAVIMKEYNQYYLANGDIKRGDRPLVINNRILVPMRQVGEAFGAKVDWDMPSLKATLSLGKKRISMVVGDAYLEINGNKVDIDTEVKLMDQRVYLPLRAVSEALGKTVQYEHDIEGHWFVVIYGDSFDYNQYASDKYQRLWIFAFSSGCKPIYGDDTILAYLPYEWAPESESFLYYYDTYQEPGLSVCGQPLQHLTSQDLYQRSRDEFTELGYNYIHNANGNFFLFNPFSQIEGKKIFVVYSFDDNNPDKFQLVYKGDQLPDIYK
jgi:hypothetical protein